MKVSMLFVTCCLEPSRSRVLTQVLDNIRQQAPELRHTLTAFDNGSTEPGITELLTSNFDNVYRANQNVGYWSAIDWWLEHLSHDPPDYTYIIESDMIHYALNKLPACVEFLSKNPDIGSIRLHEYSVENRHLYNKERPLPNSRRGLWQSHTNRETGKPIEFTHACDDFWSTTFLTQLPALNRYKTMRDIFLQLRQAKRFSESDFQKMYWQRYQKTGILDGGIFHCNLNTYGADIVTGSWTNDVELKRIGYRTTRYDSITPIEHYTVTPL